MALKRNTTNAEVSLVQLRNCLVNLPSSLSTALFNANATVQNVVVELRFQSIADRKTTSKNTIVHKSIYTGWTGMNSRQKSNVQANDPAVIEIDAVFGRTLGFANFQKVSISLHIDPPVTHTVNIEPLTATDWEIIELHAGFLETNLQAQVRALPNPSFETVPHPLTLHLSPTSTANISVMSVTPEVGSAVAFLKLSPDAEVIVAPKARPRLRGIDAASMTSGSRRSASGRSLSGSTRQRSVKNQAQRAIFLRCIDESVLDNDDYLRRPNSAMAILIDSSLIDSPYLKNITYVSVSMVSPFNMNSLQRPQAQDVPSPGSHAFKVIAKVLGWDEAPSPSHALLSSFVAKSLGIESTVGGIIRVERAPPALAQNLIKSIQIRPFSSPSSTLTDGLQLGGAIQAPREKIAESLKSALGSKCGNSLLAGPITDGLKLPDLKAAGLSKWEGGVLTFEYASEGLNADKRTVRWIDGLDDKLTVQVVEEFAGPLGLHKDEAWAIHCLPMQVPRLLGVRPTVESVTKSLLHGSSVLLTGSTGSGKSSIASKVGHTLQRNYLFHVSIFRCRTMVADEIRISTIKDTMEKVFGGAAWGSRLGGRAVVIVDDLDKICPAETELQVGGENGRSRQLSELFSGLVHHSNHVSRRVTMLITAQSKNSLHNAIVGGHVTQDTVDLKAPKKDVRRQILEALVADDKGALHSNLETDDRRFKNRNGTIIDVVASDDSLPETISSEPSTGPSVDLLEIAGKTDGYMAGDLMVLVSRAKSEAVTRFIKNRLSRVNIVLTQEDFMKALQDFTPASLRNVTLHASSTKFDSVGGLHLARQILMETLQYPTAYAPIFDRCPLRLRSGILLYGYPGCGKTLLASAVAGECGLNFISVKGPEILNKYIGASEKSVRDLFERAEAAKPCILFFDEFDSIAPKRGHDSTGVTDRVVNQLLTQMDGAEGLSGVYVLAATSRPDLIDPALLRPGRLDKSLICNMPSLEERLDILRAVSKDLSVDASITGNTSPKHTLTEVARRTEGYTGADLQAIMYNAHLEAIHTTLAKKGGASTNDKSSRPFLQPSRKQYHGQKEYIRFHFGKSDEDGSQKQPIAQHDDQMSALRARIDAIKIAKRKERQLRSGKQDPDTLRQQSGEKVSDIIISWNHIDSSLASTRSSMSAEERRKLDRIYREFLSARDGDMPSGQGPTEVGARSSLM